MEVLAACHVHSKWSYDGSWSLEELSAEFSRRGYSVVMMTEHDRGFTPERLKEYREACAKASTHEIFVMPGIEYSDAANRIHVLVWGPVPFLGEGLPTGQMLEEVQAAGGLAILAHPSRKEVWKSFEPYWGNLLLGIEVWNRKYDGWAPSQTAPSLLEASNGVPFVGLDFHTDRQLFPLAMALELEEDISEDAILNCLKSRKCYPRALGVSYSEALFNKASILLRMAERCRKTAASVVRYPRRLGRSRSRT